MNVILATLLPVLLTSGNDPELIDSGILTEIGDLLTTFLGWVVANRMILIFFTLGIIGFVIGLFKRSKRAVR